MTEQSVGPTLLEVHVEALEQALLQGEFQDAAESCSLWIGHLSELHAPLANRLLYVAIQSHWFLHRQTELSHQLDAGYGLMGLHPQAFILWQLMQLEAGQAAECRSQIQQYVHQMIHWLDTHLNIKPDVQEPGEGLPQVHTVFRCGTVAPPGPPAPALEALRAHSLPLCRLYVVDVLCHGLKEYGTAQQFLTSTEAMSLLQEPDVHMLSAEVVAAQLAAAAQGSSYVTMMGEPNDDEHPHVSVHHTAAADRAETTLQESKAGGMSQLVSKAWHWGRTAIFGTAFAAASNRVSSSSGSADLVEWQVISEGHPGEHATDDRAPDGPAGLPADQASPQSPAGTPIEQHQQPSNSTEPLPSQAKLQDWVLQVQLWLRRLQTWLVKHSCNQQILEVAQTLLLALLVYALYREWKVVRGALITGRNRVRSLLTVAFALSPNPLTSGYMPRRL